MTTVIGSFRSHALVCSVTAISWCAVLSSDSHARLGETAQACVERYGQPIEVHRDRPAMTFKVNGVTNILGKALTVTCCFPTAEPTSICEEIVYKNLPDIDAIERMVEVNSQGSKWQPVKKSFEGQWQVLNWSREDGAAAEHNEFLGLRITSKERNAANKERGDKARKQEQDQKNGRLRGL